MSRANPTISSMGASSGPCRSRKRQRGYDRAGGMRTSRCPMFYCSTISTPGTRSSGRPDSFRSTLWPALIFIGRGRESGCRSITMRRDSGDNMRTPAPRLSGRRRMPQGTSSARRIPARRISRMRSRPTCGAVPSILRGQAVGRLGVTGSESPIGLKRGLINQAPTPLAGWTRARSLDAALRPFDLAQDRLGSGQAPRNPGLRQSPLRPSLSLIPGFHSVSSGLRG